MTFLIPFILIPILWLLPIIGVILFLPFHLIGGKSAIIDLWNVVCEWYRPSNLKYFAILSVCYIGVITLFMGIKTIILG